MSTERFEMQKVGLDYFENAPYLFRSTVVIRCTPQQLFASFEDADAWPAWAMPISTPVLSANVSGVAAWAMPNRPAA